MAENWLVGNYTHSLDSKNRVFFPAKFREDLGEAFIITFNLDRALSAYSLPEWENFMEKLRSLPKTQVKDITRFFCGNAIKTTPDKQGRVMLTKELLDFAGIDGDITFVGCGDRVELWPGEKNPLEKYNSDFIDGITAQMLELGI